MWRMVFVLVLMGLCVHTAAALPGSGTQQDPWRIQSLADFDEFAAEPNYWAGFTRLETDVNLAGRTYSTAVIAPDVDNSNYEFDGTSFTGVFDGNDHKLIGLTIDDGETGNDFLGLFGCIVEDSQVSNVGLEGAFITGEYYVGALLGTNGNEGLWGWYYPGGAISNCYSTGDVNGTGGRVGGLVGYNGGNISNCYSTVSVNGNGGLVGANGFGDLEYGVWCPGYISNSYSTGDVNGYGGGGLVGESICGGIGNCYSTGDVSGTEGAVGGLVAWNDSGLHNCYSTGNVNGDYYVGGLLGVNFFAGDVSNCYSTGDVNGVGDYVGGLLGWNGWGYSSPTSVSNCFWDTDTQTHGVTESIGVNEGIVTYVEGLSTAQMKTKSTFTGADWDFVNIWDICEGTNYPRFIWQIPSADRLCPDGVGFEDFSYLADGWLLEFGINDLATFCEQWLEGK